MTAKPEPSPLVKAVQEFDEQLARYGALTESLGRASLAGEQNLERAIAKLGQLAECEERLGVCAQNVMQTLNAARAKQEQQATVALEHARAIQQRKAQMAALLREVQEIGAEVAGLNHVAAAVMTAAAGDADGSVAIADVDGITSQVGGLADRARQVSVTAREQEFPEIASQTHALNQKLLAMQAKLRENATARPDATS